MKRLFLSSLGMLVYITSCNDKSLISSNKDYKQIVITEANITPTIDIKNFTLITNDLEADSSEAIEILKIKRKMPLAMQTRDSTLFENILSKNFTFRAEDEFYNRKDYIHDRIHGLWNIDTVKYINLVVQIFGEIALLTYRNILIGNDDNGKPDTEYYTWANYYRKENGQWKVMSIHQIDARTEYPGR